MEKVVLSGNEAFARGAWEAGVNIAAAYPGTPSTEILENLVKYPDVYCQWSPNEKVALEFAAGAALAGARTLACMKHVGLNVAADPLMTLTYIGIKGGMALIVADDPGMHSSQNEQDTRHYARLARAPLLEPSDSEEAKEYIGLAYEISEQFRTPVILKSTTRVSHSKGVVAIGERKPHKADGYEKNPQLYVPVPIYGRKMRVALEERFQKLQEYACAMPQNMIVERSNDLGIITSGIAYQYAAEIFPEASFLKLAMPFPFPDDLIIKFSKTVKRILVVEELDNFLEEHVRSLGIAAEGKKYIPGIGELSLDVLEEARKKFEGKTDTAKPAVKPAPKVPPRPPVFCPGCPHRGVFYEISKLKPVVIGDIGCYSLAVFPPLSAMDMILCMGAGISSAHGAQKADTGQKIVGVVGDSTFFHSGITGLLDIGYNKGKLVIFVLDNRSTAMTGHQEHPGTGRTLMGQPTHRASIEAFARACGINRVVRVDPYDLPKLRKVIKDEMDADEASVIITEAPCILIDHSRVKEPMRIDPDECKSCGLCLKLSCPGLEKKEVSGGKFKVEVNPVLCRGCELCVQVCPFGAIKKQGEKS
ncbi:MAG TPA: indolepyruvate ferredoxin oxidoreductase subunit alpha [Candidatus Sumerlaeota bacterium]|nr:MAG: indolepyruvate ferredoxin oxidoreductase [candidate division BRC1 bacterium ADurb.Bin183]HOE63802.1 indolepyruvate ferredoxin oxidoreductase subunit alpha [Candidatus Sumerlaeota bacterium]HRR30086.1 indolepyruvate ferredoxin oxidoreductase subunit alpha [Candidatus Sumerlaeia bacterium]HON49747.1 indolepyruvate ferredoxin oxidoreductase subunit alpha [Candidatus Sumerlaeota bacterium]HOR64005.1 indolepyruvate ferredoxin oxidoreductase subunit alpha [Candidatus Sumerlaeota bacterium]